MMQLGEIRALFFCKAPGGQIVQITTISDNNWKEVPLTAENASTVLKRLN